MELFCHKTLDYRIRGDLVRSSIKSTTTVVGSNTPEDPDRHPNIKCTIQKISHSLIQFLQRVRADGIVLPHHTQGDCRGALDKALYVHSLPLHENLK